MHASDSDTRFGWVTQLIHWTTFLLVVALVGLGITLDDLEPSPQSSRIIALHKSLGITVLGLTALRIAWRIVAPLPPILGQPRTWERMAARAAHGIFYALLVAVPVTGWLTSAAADLPPVWFGLVELPRLIDPDEAMKDLLRDVHGTLVWTMVGLLLLHIAAAIRHHVVVGDDTIRRMLPGYRGPDGGESSNG